MHAKQSVEFWESWGVVKLKGRDEGESFFIQGKVLPRLISCRCTPDSTRGFHTRSFSPAQNKTDKVVLSSSKSPPYIRFDFRPRYISWSLLVIFSIWHFLSWIVCFVTLQYSRKFCPYHQRITTLPKQGIKEGVCLKAEHALHLFLNREKLKGQIIFAAVYLPTAYISMWSVFSTACVCYNWFMQISLGSWDSTFVFSCEFMILMFVAQHHIWSKSSEFFFSFLFFLFSLRSMSLPKIRSMCKNIALFFLFVFFFFFGRVLLHHIYAL